MFFNFSAGTLEEEGAAILGLHSIFGCKILTARILTEDPGAAAAILAALTLSIMDAAFFLVRVATLKHT